MQTNTDVRAFRLIKTVYINSGKTAERWLASKS